MGKIYKGMTELIGGTPLMEAANLEKELGLEATLLLKLEYFNPAGSVKDRIAKAMIEDAEAKGLLKEGSVIIEPTSGNTGIGLAAIAAVKGYRMILTMPETMSVERRNIVKAYGAEVVLTEGAKGMSGAIAKAEELAREIPGSFIPGQFVNPANPAAHKATTGPEIWRDTDGAVDIFVAGVGTGGTITGIGEYLKEQKGSVQVVAVEPATSPVLSEGHGGSHKIQGIAAGFVPDVLHTAVVTERMLAGQIEAISVPSNPLDILAQQTIAACAIGPLDVEAWFETVKRSAPFRTGIARRSQSSQIYSILAYEDRFRVVRNKNLIK